ncbi:helix-turn-helix transcriptional regulator [Neobacillus sp. WH10]|uniref:helix-turn-helix domain-containing protein n=1 Tax=Neobacillus sp. WH10 TaxID=3047873 RepID=UPI0024C12C34|nr:helix-turn-helix transcriptional regulator [Neobacillus sp. WH10]WHY76266.1 helix-turn-helix transcriptional regulator [Neobacillus sp. WH10]
MSDTKKIFGERLRKLRRDRGMEVKDLAFKLSLAPTTIYGYENGSRGPDVDILKVIADFFNVTTDYLLGRSNHPKLTEIEDGQLDKETRELMETVESLPIDLRKQFWQNAKLMKKHLENK